MSGKQSHQVPWTPLKKELQNKRDTPKGVSLAL